jgi:hypothetical protein
MPCSRTLPLAAGAALGIGSVLWLDGPAHRAQAKYQAKIMRNPQNEALNNARKLINFVISILQSCIRLKK